jgi:predicted MFS family arabinose efflux permease
MLTTAHRWTTVRSAAVLVYAVSVLVIDVLPAITGVLARELRFDPGALGAFASANMLGYAASGIVAIVLMRRASPRAVVLAGLTILFAANLGSAVVSHATSLVMLQALGGVGTGLAISACYYVYSLADRERNTGAALLSETALATVGMLGIPVLVQKFGWRGLFVSFALLVVPALVLARQFPRDYRDEKSGDGPATSQASQLLTWSALISVSLCGVAIFAMWTYLERIGTEAGLSLESISSALAICTVSGAISSVIVLVCGERVNGTLPLLACVVLNTVGVVATRSSNALIYTVAISVFYFSLPLYLAIQFGAIMHRIHSRRFTVLYTLAQRCSSFGPLAGGLVAQRHGFAAVRWLAIALMLLAAGILWSGFMMRRRFTRIGPSAPAQLAKTPND